MKYNKEIKGVLLVAASFFLLFSSCKKEAESTNHELVLINNFLEERNIVAEPTLSGMYYIEMVEGIGDFPVTSDTLDVFYKGMFLDGRVFESNYGGNPFTFPLGEGRVIQGWDEGLTYMKQGGKALLIIPSYLAYGTYGQGAIPGNTPLLFEIELVSFIPGPNHGVK